MVVRVNYPMSRPLCKIAIHLLSLVLISSYVLLGSSQDSAKVHAAAQSIFGRAIAERWSTLPIGEVVAKIGASFVGAPYEAGTLDHGEKEELVLNLTSFDCVTFVENVLALARCVKSEKYEFDAYSKELECIRYRSGVRNGYASRLHYFSDWIYDNSWRNLVENPTESLGEITVRKKIDWMTTHRASYKQLHDSTQFAAIVEIEKELSQRKLSYISTANIERIEARLKEGDILAMVTKKEGLDVAHTGIAVQAKDGSIHYLHAPNVNGSVNITTQSLHAYVANNKSYLGIVVARPRL